MEHSTWYELIYPPSQKDEETIECERESLAVIDHFKTCNHDQCKICQEY